MQRGGGGEVTEAMVVDHAEDGGVLETGDGLAGLVVVGEDDELRLGALGSGLNGVDQRRRDVYKRQAIALSLSPMIKSRIWKSTTRLSRSARRRSG